MRWERKSVQRGMPVLDDRGHRIGTVRVCGPRTFTVRSGLLRQRLRSARYEDIRSLAGGSIHLEQGAVDSSQPAAETSLWSAIHPLAEP
jgi:hypothetical protein